MKTTILLMCWLFFTNGILAQEETANAIPYAQAQTLGATTYEEEKTLTVKPFTWWSVKHNLLYDVALIPNIGVETYIGKQWSLAGNWMYAWWSSNPKHKYWRTYGGDLELRRWWGKKAKEKPLTGYHAGIYLQALTYDVEFGGRGYLADRFSYGGGVSIGFTQPVTPRLNADFTIGVGYIRGEYKEYLPIDGNYVWQCTKMRNYMGPTKAEITLIWLIGPGNKNKHDSYCGNPWCRKRAKGGGR